MLRQCVTAGLLLNVLFGGFCTMPMAEAHEPEGGHAGHGQMEAGMTSVESFPAVDCDGGHCLLAALSAELPTAALDATPLPAVVLASPASPVVHDEKRRVAMARAMAPPGAGTDTVVLRL